MKFYNREKELASLEKVRRVSFSVHSQMTVLTGRRRIGKTSLIFKSCEGTPTGISVCQPQQRGRPLFTLYFRDPAGTGYLCTGTYQLCRNIPLLNGFGYTTEIQSGY